MPGNKRWYVEATESGLILYRDGKKAYYPKGKEGNRLLGPIKEVLHVGELSQARGFKQYAIEVIDNQLFISYMM